MANSRQPLDLISATTIVAASMIGVGVYTTSGFTLEALGSPTRVIWAWGIGGVIAIGGSIGYASLASRFTESGGEYLFLARSLHPVAGMMAGWVSLLAGFTGAVAAAAIGLEEYFRPLFAAELSWLPDKSIAIGAVLLTAMLHAIGVRRAARTQDVVVGLKMLLIAGFIAYAMIAIGQGTGETAGSRVGRIVEPGQIELQRGSEPLVGEGIAGESASTSTDESALAVILAFSSQLVWISLSFAGFNAAVYLSGEIQDARRNVPRAMIGGTVLVTVIYIVLNGIFVFATPHQVIAGQPQVATLAAESIGGTTFSGFVRYVIVLSLFTSVSALTMTGPRVYAKMADDGLFPGWFRFSGQTPIHAIAFQAIFAIVVITASSLKELIGYLGLTLSICSALTVSMVFVLRRRGELTRLPLWGIPPLVYVAATLTIAALSAISDPKQMVAALLTFVVGIVSFPIIQRRRAVL